LIRAFLRRRRRRERLVGALEERWRAWLPGGRIPTTMLRRLEKTEQFRRWLDDLGSGGLTLDDIEHLHRYYRRPNGQVGDRLVEELGEDPWLYVCRECFADVDKGAGSCPDCRDFNAGG
jgi:hypothetical protein